MDCSNQSESSSPPLWTHLVIRSQHWFASSCHSESERQRVVCSAAGGEGGFDVDAWLHCQRVTHLDEPLQPNAHRETQMTIPAVVRFGWIEPVVCGHV